MSKEVLGALSKEVASSIEKEYSADKTNVVIRHALSRSPISDALFDSSSKEGTKMAFSVEVPTMKVANQRSSGRCWIFAGLNVLREIVAKKCGMKEFELSQNYISLFDKIEKANYALESIIKLCDRKPDERVFQFILSSPISDGGQWDMFVNLVKKYGLLPQNAFPETFQSNNTMESNKLVNGAIRSFACKARKLKLAGKDDEIRTLKEKVISDIYKLYLNCFGVPPKSLDFEYVDEKNEYHIEEGLTPITFFEKYIGDEIDQYQSLINSPTEDKPYGRNYTVDFLGNVVEGKAVNHLNVEMDRMEELIIAQLKDGKPVWFGSDVGFFRDRNKESFAWDTASFDYKSAFGFDIKFAKGDMLDFHHSAMGHAMLITGVNLVNGKPTRWKIENSWGGDNGSAGYYVMSADFFDTFVYQAVVLRKYLNEDELKAAEADPIHLDPWDPMGTLA